MLLEKEKIERIRPMHLPCIRSRVVLTVRTAHAELHVCGVLPLHRDIRRVTVCALNTFAIVCRNTRRKEEKLTNKFKERALQRSKNNNKVHFYLLLTSFPLHSPGPSSANPSETRDCGCGVHCEGWRHCARACLPPTRPARCWTAGCGSHYLKCSSL